MERELKIVRQHLEDGQYINPLFDPVQTHAIYGIDDLSEIIRLKKILKYNKLAYKFRNVKTNYGSYILCFRVKKTQNK